MFLIQEIIKQEAISLPMGESMSITCPKCIEDFEIQGRPSNTWNPNKSCSISRNKKGLLYKCHRASCGLSGFTGSITFDKSIDKKQFKPKEYPYPTVALSNTQIKWFSNKYGLFKSEILKNKFRFNPERKSIVMPIFNYLNYDVGVVDRDFFNGRKPKAISYWFNDVTKVHFPRGWDYQQSSGKAIPVVIVEDILSAIKVSRYLPCIALLGSHLSDDVVHHLHKFFSKVLISLDDDAINNSLKAKRKYGVLFEDFKIIHTPQDPKDMSAKKLNIFYGGYSKKKINNCKECGKYIRCEGSAMCEIAWKIHSKAIWIFMDHVGYREIHPDCPIKDSLGNINVS
jgi:hypothetical protein